MKRKLNGDASLYTRGVDRRDFLGRIGTSSAAAALAMSALKGEARVARGRTVMLEEMNHEMFAGKVGGKFEVQLGGVRVAFELIDARQIADAGARPASLARREGFSLIFRAPQGTTAPQQIYQVNHPELGTFGIFLVPIGPDAEGPRYEAVFN